MSLRKAALAAVAVLCAAGLAVPALTARPAGADSGVTVYACVTTSHTFSRVSVNTPLPCPSGAVAVSWPGQPGAPMPSPSPTSTSPSPTPTVTSPTPTPTDTSPSPSPTDTSPSPSPTATASAFACTVAGFASQCGPYSDPAIYGSTAGQVGYVGNQNVNLTPGETGTMRANGLGDWQATVSAPDNGGAVSEWSNSNVALTRPDNTPVPLASLSTLTSELDIAAQTTAAGTSEDLGWDVWGGTSGSSSNNYGYEMMIWSQSINRGTCGGGTVLRTGVTFGTQTFSLCEWGTGAAGEFIWYLSDASGTPASSEDTTVDIDGMLQWMIAQGYYPAGYGLNMVTVGSEVCSTGGVPETVTLHKWTLTAS